MKINIITATILCGTLFLGGCRGQRASDITDSTKSTYASESEAGKDLDPETRKLTEEEAKAAAQKEYFEEEKSRIKEELKKLDEEEARLNAEEMNINQKRRELREKEEKLMSRYNRYADNSNSSYSSGSNSSDNQMNSPADQSMPKKTAETSSTSDRSKEKQHSGGKSKEEIKKAEKQQIEKLHGHNCTPSTVAEVKKWYNSLSSEEKKQTNIQEYIRAYEGFFNAKSLDAIKKLNGSQKYFSPGQQKIIWYGYSRGQKEFNLRYQKSKGMRF